MPTDARAANNVAKLPAKPENAVATLQQPTPKAMRCGRERRSPRAPNTGATSVNTIRKPGISRAQFGVRQREFRVFQALHQRRHDVAVQVVEKIDE